MAPKSKTTVSIPSDFEILATPALAATAVLDAALHVAAAAVTAEHPDLDEIDSPTVARYPPMPSLVYADLLIKQIRSLQPVLERYIAAERFESAPSPNDYPF
jgi:hypothetical protein